MQSQLYGKNHCCGRKWCNKDPCGIVCAFITWLLLFYGQFCILSVMMATWQEYMIHQTINFIVFEIFSLLAFSSHLKTMLTDPGAVPKGTLTEEYISRLEQDRERGSIIYKCTKCSAIRPERAHHCSVCERCIRRMDHHCPWVNNCVGEANQKYFVLFTFYIALLSFLTLYWAIWQFVTCIGVDWRGCSAFSAPATTILLIFLLFEAVLFSIFTAVMFGTQLSAICSDQTGIESLKKDRNEKSHDSWKNLQVVFGGPFSLKWLNPFVVPFISDKAFEFSV